MAVKRNKSKRRSLWNHKKGSGFKKLLSSFNHEYIREAYKLAPDISRTTLQKIGHHENLVEYLKDLHVQGYNPDSKIADKKTITELNEAGFFVNIFTVKDQKDKKEFFERGARSNFTIISGLVWHNHNYMILIIYQPHNPKASGYYKCVENYFEELEQVWDDMYKSRYGY